MSARHPRGLIAAVVAGGLLTLAVPATAGERLIPAKADAVSLQDGSVRTVVSVPDLPPGDHLDPAGVRVTVGGRAWPATAVPVEESASVGPRSAIVVVDTSGSMGAAGIAAAQAAANRFLDVAPADVAIGLVTFSDEVRVVVPPTTERQLVRDGLAGMVPRGETKLYDGLGVALDALGGEGERAVIVLSDGADTASGTPRELLAQALAESGAQVDFVAFKTDEGQVGVLNELAVSAGGRVHEAATGDELAGVFASAASALGNQVVVTAEVPPGVEGRVDVVVEVPSGSGRAVAGVPALVPPGFATAEIAGTVAAADPVVQERIRWLLPAVVVVSFLALLLLFGIAFTPGLFRAASSQQRIREVQRYAVVDGATPVAEAAPTAVSQAALAWAERAVEQRGLEESWRMDLDRAQVPLKPHEWLLVRLSVATVCVALGFVFLPWWLLTAPLAGMAGYLVSGLYVRIRAARRLRKFGNDLPDILQLIAGSLRSGFSLPQAFDNAAKDGEEPARGEFSRALAEARLGIPLEDTLDRVAVRMKSSDLEWTVMAIRIAREVGGNLAEVLLGTAETMRERGRIKRQVKVLSAEGRLSAYVLLGLPVGLTLWMVSFRRDYISPLVTDPIGWAMTAFGVVSVAIGAFWMSRLVKMEV